MHRPDDRPPASPELEAIRAEIDRLDLTLVDLIARRAALARRTAPLKSREHLDFTDHRREAALVRRAAERARGRGIDPEPVRAIFWRLVELSHRSANPGRPALPEAPRSPGGRDG